jgi:hypothetical protein
MDVHKEGRERRGRRIKSQTPHQTISLAEHLHQAVATGHHHYCLPSRCCWEISVGTTFFFFME